MEDVLSLDNKHDATFHVAYMPTCLLPYTYGTSLRRIYTYANLTLRCLVRLAVGS